MVRVGRFSSFLLLPATNKKTAAEIDSHVSKGGGGRGVSALASVNMEHSIQSSILFLFSLVSFVRCSDPLSTELLCTLCHVTMDPPPPPTVSRCVQAVFRRVEQQQEYTFHPLVKAVQCLTAAQVVRVLHALIAAPTPSLSLPQCRVRAIHILFVHVDGRIWSVNDAPHCVVQRCSALRELHTTLSHPMWGASQRRVGDAVRAFFPLLHTLAAVHGWRHMFRCAPWEVLPTPPRVPALLSLSPTPSSVDMPAIQLPCSRRLAYSSSSSSSCGPTLAPASIPTSMLPWRTSAQPSTPSRSHDTPPASGCCSMS